ncbi:hypothetical protein [Chondromyces crocatus]|uniref:hypothetical protein n=1 Tax=Chondromyces crocatus TaxID=52 RepID=UPI0012E1FA5F|nr:hypothetical protein [Chondromyces crocatus]
MIAASLLARSAQASSGQETTAQAARPAAHGDGAVARASTSGAGTDRTGAEGAAPTSPGGTAAVAAQEAPSGSASPEATGATEQASGGAAAQSERDAVSDPQAFSGNTTEAQAGPRDAKAAQTVALDAGALKAEGVSRPASKPSWWIGSGLQMDTVLLPGGDVCGRESQSSGRYACFRGDREQYLGTPGGGAGTDAGTTLAYGTTRVLLHAERSVLARLSVGGRLGLAFGGGPAAPQGAAFMPLHMEVRGSYWILGGLDGDQPLNLFATVLGGVAQIDASRKVSVEECRAGMGGCTPSDNAQPGVPNPDRQELDAYVKLGQGFAGLGFGAMYRFPGQHAVMADLRAVQTFPSHGTAFSLSLSYVVRAP